MNLAKHMEAVFVVALAVAGSASYVTDVVPQAQAEARSAIVDSSIATETKMAVVVVKGKRPDAGRQVTLLAERGNPGSRI